MLRGELVGDAKTARLLLDAARYLGETLDPQRVYERFREILGRPSTATASSSRRSTRASA